MTINHIDRKYLPPSLDDAQDFCHVAALYDVISFDVFETLLHRRDVFKPTDLFLEIGEAVREVSGLPPSAFAALRIRGERDARNALAGRGAEEVTIREIYEGFNRQLPTQGRPLLAPAALDALVAAEQRVELEHLRPIESVRRFYDWAVDAGKTVVLVSDFYAPASFLEEALNRNGFSRHHRLFVSCDLNRTKHHGSLFDHVCRALEVAPSQVLHVGDNPWSDGSRALQVGIAHLRTHNPAADLIRYHGLDRRQPNAQLTSLAQARIADDLFGSGLERRRPQDMPLPRRIGREVLGPLLLGLASWLYDEAGREGYDRYFFCSRDGLIMKRAYDLYQQRFGSRTDSRYLEVSRQVIYRAQAALEPEEAQSLFVQNWSSLTPADALSRWGIAPQDCAAAIREAGFGSPDEVVIIDDAAGQARLADLFQLCRGTLGAANAAHAEIFLAYLRQSGILDAAAPCIVDIGWHGSLQKGLSRLLQANGARGPLAGRYLGLFLDAETLRTFPAAGYLFSMEGTAHARALHAGPSLVELLHTAGHGATAGYAREGGRIRATFEDRPDERAQYRTKIAPIQEQALGFVADVLGNPRLRPAPMEPGEAFAGLRRLLNHPDREEVEGIGSWRIAVNYGATATSTALTVRSPAGYLLWNIDPA